jgi:hypothetical protein
MVDGQSVLDDATALVGVPIALVKAFVEVRYDGRILRADVQPVDNHPDHSGIR